MAGAGDQGEAEAVCQVEGCEDPVAYLVCYLKVDAVGRLVPGKSKENGVCAADYRRMVLGLKALALKGGGTLEPPGGVKKL